MVILITGVSSGFGKQMAARLVADGHVVYGTVRREVEKMEGVHYLMADVRNESDAVEAVGKVLAEQGCIDVFINNAGMGIGGPIELTSSEDAHLQMETNFFGLVNFVKAVLPSMRERGCGKIIAVSSIGGQIGLPFQGFYSASKYAIEGYCEALRLETRRFGVKVVLVNPGDFATGFTGSRKKIPLDVAQAYPRYAASMNSIEKDENGGLKPEVLASRISRIAVKKNPAFRYTVASPLQSLAVKVKAILPSRVFAWVMSLYYKV